MKFTFIPGIVAINLQENCIHYVRRGLEHVNKYWNPYLIMYKFLCSYLLETIKVFINKPESLGIDRTISVLETHRPGPDLTASYN